jgi:predicted Zn-dependent protease
VWYFFCYLNANETGQGMAEPENLEEDIVIIEDEELTEYTEQKDDSSNKVQEQNDKKKKIIIFSSIALILVLIIIFTFIMIFKSKDEIDSLSMDAIEERLDDSKQQKTIESSKLENMIAKANYLYSTGSKEQALKIYEKIAMFSEAISQYNLGVSQLKNKQYEAAMDTFSKAINSDEKRCVSSINAAVCALHLNDEASFKYYIDLAYSYLPQELESPLYSYYYALISYYNNNYLEALSALENPTSDSYLDIQKDLSVKINALYGNNYKSIEGMESSFTEKDAFSIALLYARIGDLTLAINHLEDSVLKAIEPVKSEIALGLLKLKAGRVSEGGSNILNATEKYGDEVYTHYPINVKLKSSIFEPEEAQKQYREKILSSKLLNYQKLFYFSPYKVFNANKNISYIRKGTANISIDNIASAQDYLKKSASTSNVNKGIAQAIKKALSFKTREANSELEKLAKFYPKHSILQYNLALTYAQMGNMIKAHEHFLRSYYLDAKNYLSGIYAVMTGQLVNKNTDKLKSIIKDNLELEEWGEDTDFYNTLLQFGSDNMISAIDWLDNTYRQRPIYLALSSLIAINLNRNDYAQSAAKELTLLLPNDIVPHIMYIDAYFDVYSTKEYAKKVIAYLRKQSFHFSDLYYGPYISRYLLIQQNLITGQLYYLTRQIKKVLETTINNREDLISALALALLYNGSYEESYTLYNQLIDDMMIRDAQTLFLGAVASIAAEHHPNAIALLELSKMKDSEFYESRYALGLLYLEVNKNKAAAIQFGKVKENGFQSEYFNFDIDLDKLLFIKRNNLKE